MSRTSGICLEYVTAKLEVEFNFPKDEIICDLCNFCRSENAGTRFRCNLTSEILAAHNKTIGRRCPLDLPNPYHAIDEEEEGV